ncbi:hypothetical protein CO172_02110 [Candidatus Uhrbacteria bacterium CG_4_9_14_3_um_filter_36_7]|uniref:Uncharacterized protein n=1 Tax=Candidatus Uhrbacteria bacterium CG_4_9_14_3_um_filter_36_7 TaxID=1975033 RepID=A0A2M7XHG1_9BACT|nr:MAG: hypothetical protein CO172_02110 [Candidatus Uhrbacteria bacterium CG_4_9_14_3_um_filter_36_7]
MKTRLLFGVVLVVLIVTVIFGIWFKTLRNPVRTIVNETNQSTQNNTNTTPNNNGPKNIPSISFLYQTTRIIDDGKEEWRNDDTDETTLYRIFINDKNAGDAPTQKITSIISKATTGSVISEVFGEKLLVHRYKTNPASEQGVISEYDALVKLNGSFQIFQTPGWQSMIASKNGEIFATWQTTSEPKNRYLITKLSVKNIQGDILTEKIFDPSVFGITMGEIEPFLINNAGDAVYLRNVFGGEGYTTGVWRFDIKTGEVKSYPYLTDNKIWQFRVDPGLEKLVGVTFSVPTEMGTPPTGPSSIHILDLKTEEGQKILEDQTLVFQNPFIDPDGKSISFSYSSDVRDSVVWIVPIGEAPENQDIKISGRLLDWVSSWLVVNRNQEIILYNTQTKQLISLAESKGFVTDPDYITVEYIGNIETK